MVCAFCFGNNMNCTKKIIELESALKKFMTDFLAIVETLDKNQEFIEILSNQVIQIKEVMVLGGVASYATEDN